MIRREVYDADCEAVTPAFAFLNGIIHENEASCLVRDYKWKSISKIDVRRKMQWLGGVHIARNVERLWVILR